MITAPPTNGNGKKTVLEVIGEAVPLILVISSIGGMALVPLYIKADHNEQKIDDLAKRFSEHEKLAGHPVTITRMDGEIRRLDERISVNDKWTGDIQTTAGNLAGAFQAEKAKTEASFIEVETQIDSMAQGLGIQFSTQQRYNADVQNALHDLKSITPVAPPGPWYVPNISNRTHK